MDQTGSSSTNGLASWPAVRLVFLAVGIIVFLLVAWIGRVIVMLLLAAVVFAVLLSAVVDWVRTKLMIRRGLAFALLLAAGFVLMFFKLWIRGPRIIEQFADLQTDLPQAAHKFFWNVCTLIKAAAGYSPSAPTAVTPMTIMAATAKSKYAVGRSSSSATSGSL
jgi:predicted PurR-regulated permease PerM